MSESLSALLYLVASICFIMALRGLSSPETARGGNIFGIVGMVIGLTIGAITFTGSVVAFAKLQGLVSGRPLVFPGQHLINLALGILLIVLIVLFVMTEAGSLFLLLVLLSLAF